MMVSSERRLSRDEQYKALSRRLNTANAKYGRSQPEKVTGIYLEMAEYLRNSLMMVEDAKQLYERAISLGQNCVECALDCSLASRNLSEIASENGDLDSAIDRVNDSLRYARKTENPGLIQQAMHERARICIICGLLEKALSYAEECRKYLVQNAMEIDELKKDGDAKCRMAHLQNVIADIYSEMHGSDTAQEHGYDKKALAHNEKALKYASERENWPLLYRSLLMKLELTVGKERLQIAQQMCAAAAKIEPSNAQERRLKRDGKCQLALEKLRFSEQCQFTEAKHLLWKHYKEINGEPDKVSEDVLESVKKALIFIYKTEQRLTKANTMNTKDNQKRRHAQMCLFERIGDEASALGMNEIALTFYQRMQQCADNAEDRRKAWCSMAEAARDLRLWPRAFLFYQQVRKLEEQLDYSESALLETDTSLAILAAEDAEIPPEQRLKRFREVYRKCRTEEQKANILPDYVKFLKAHPNLCTSGELEARMEEKLELDKRERPTQQQDEGEDEQQMGEPDEFDQLDERRVMFELEREMKVAERNEKILKERSHANNYGESNLFELARTGDYQDLKELIDRGYDINHVDNGGWTALSEAVSAQNLQNARLLLVKGANPNTRSREPLMDGDTKISSTGLSPLMEACSAGNSEIAKLLLQFTARASARDDDDWSALEHLREYMEVNKEVLKEDETRRVKLRKLAIMLEQRQNEEGFAPFSYARFRELLEQKRLAAQRNSQRRSGGSRNNSQNKEDSQRSRKRQLSGTPSPEPGRRSTESRRSSSGGVWRIEDDEEDDEKDEREDEETRNLNEYKRKINDLIPSNRTRREDPEFARAPPPPSRNGKGGGKPFAKKMFFK